MSTAWTTRQLLTPMDRLAQPADPTPRFNPRPRGQIQKGSAAEAVLALMREQPDRLFARHQLIAITGRTRKAIDWALLFLEALGHIEVSETEAHPRSGNHRFRLTPPPAQRRGRGRPRLADGQRRAHVPMRIREDLAEKLLLLGPEWLDKVVESAAIEACLAAA